MATQATVPGKSRIDGPVTKTLVDNTIDKLPTQKPRVECDDCDLSFKNQAVLDTHLQGARHAKQVQINTIMASLEESKVAFTKDEGTNRFTCDICNVCLNSLQQLQTHVNGNRHMKNISGGNTRGPQKVIFYKCDRKNKEPVREAALPPFPAPVTTAGVSAPTKTVTLACKRCNKLFNTQAQYNVIAQLQLNIRFSQGESTLIPFPACLIACLNGRMSLS
ncbi:zinc finger protein 346 isoform X2 [Orussus abietinus]|uniref:zinc finger protein 346 isoform X2 n=1 Tax=Orussus abietinus TaxID=222816 RepID=UPI0006266298|nr:zinc finger protein 346 isoform X2 [Orussus abietinus]